MQHESSIEIESRRIEFWLVLHAADLELDQSRGIIGELFQDHLAFHNQLYDFVYAEPRVERYRLVKIEEEDAVPFMPEK